MDLGLALLSVRAVPFWCYSHRDIAAWAGCTRQAIYQIEHRALRKLKFRVASEWNTVIHG